MNKKLQAVLVFTFIQITFSFGQASGYIFNDANALINDTNPTDRLSVLAYYAGKPKLSAAQADSIQSANKFIFQALGSTPNYFTSKSNFAGGAHAQGALGSIGSFNVTNIADGLAKFIIARGKQELSASFFNSFKKDLIKYPELVTLFPRASAIIKNIDTYNILTLLQQLQDAFKKDLLELPTNMLSFRDKDTSMCYGDKNCINQIDNLGDFMNGPHSKDFVIPLISVQGILDGKNIIDIANDVATDKSFRDSADTFAGYLKLSAILLESVRNSQESKGLFISTGDLKTMFLNANVTNAFLGLILLKYSSLPDYKNLRINGENLTTLLGNVQSGQAALINGMKQMDNLNAFILNFKKQPAPELYASITVTSLGLLGAMGYTIHEIVNGQLPTEISTLKKDYTIATDFVNDIQKKNYTGIYNDATQLLGNIKLLKGNQEKIMKYLAFASNLATASNSDEIQQALESVALPPGSYSVKQKSSWNISLNSYIGYGWNWGTNDGKLAMRGISTPIGFSFSKGLSKKHGGAISLFTSFIDIGGLAADRLQNGGTDTLKQVVTLESIFSPSAQLIFEVPGTPLTLCGGIRNTPKLSFNNGAQLLVIPTKSVFNLSILIDVPFFTLYNKPYQD